MASRIVIEEPCEHGVGPDESCGVQICDHPHASRHRIYTKRCHCPGGSRRVLTEGEYLLIEKVDGEWPLWAIDQASGKSVLDALAGGES